MQYNKKTAEQANTMMKFRQWILALTLLCSLPVFAQHNHAYEPYGSPYNYNESEDCGIAYEDSVLSPCTYYTILIGVVALAVVWIALTNTPGHGSHGHHGSSSSSH